MTNQTSLKPVMTSVSQARGLPNEHYISEDVFHEERQAVLFNNWSGVGFGKDIPNPGDARPVQFLGMPLLLVRDHDGSIGVFQNTCRHRGMILVEKAENIRGTIRCPYHSWCYSLNGALRATPHVGGPGHNTHAEIQRDDLGLVRIRSHVWNDVIFVNVSGKAGEFEEVHSDLLERWSDFDQPIFHGGQSSSFKLTVKSNWKLAVENYCEGYHLPWVHPGLATYSRLEDHFNIELRGKYSGQGVKVYDQIRGEDDKIFPDFGKLGAKWDASAEYLAVYPNVLMGIHRDHFYSILLEPVDFENTVEHIEIYYAKPPEDTPELEDLRAANATLWKGVFEEDVFVVEGMQKGRYGSLFDGGKFSPVMDGPTHNFHHWVASQVDAVRRA